MWRLAIAISSPIGGGDCLFSRTIRRPDQVQLAAANGNVFGRLNADRRPPLIRDTTTEMLSPTTIRSPIFRVSTSITASLR
jgi:hypothetical protein